MTEPDTPPIYEKPVSRPATPGSLKFSLEKEPLSLPIPASPAKSSDISVTLPSPAKSIGAVPPSPSKSLGSVKATAAAPPPAVEKKEKIIYSDDEDSEDDEEEDRRELEGRTYTAKGVEVCF